jgi:arylsulfatase A-like enzyme
VAGLTAPLLVSVLWSKLDKLCGAMEAVRPRDVLAALGLDVTLLLVLGGACAAVLQSARRPWWHLAAGLLHLVVLAGLLLSVVDHAFFASQREYLPGQMLVYAISNIAMLQGVLWSKLTPGSVAALVVALATPLLPAALSRLRGLREAGWPRRRWLWIGWAAAVGASLAAASLPLPAEVAYLKGNAVVNLVREALATDERPALPIAARSEPTRLEPFREERTPHNVVFVILESARALSTTPYAPDLATTPFLARLARRGLRVEHAYTTIPHTSKALISILCGRDPRVGTAIHEARPGGIPGPCLPGLLAAEGYATAFIQPAEEEFERRRELVANLGVATFMGKESLPSGFEESSYFGYEDASILEPALDWLDRTEPPFFLSLLTLTAHHDYRLPQRWPMRPLAEDPTLNRYLNALSYADRLVGELFEAFAERGLLEETLFVVVGDHGEAFGEHGRWEHDNVLHEEGVRVPLLLVGAGVDGPGLVRGLRTTSDLLPTVAEILGYRVVGDRVSGRSLLSTEGHRTLFFSCWYARQCMALREGSRKTIYHYEHGGTEVFDLATDPREAHDLSSGSAEARERARDAVRRLKAWKARNDAEYRAHFRALSGGG